MTSVNVLDSVAVAAVLLMGEATQRRPLALVQSHEAAFTQGLCPEQTREEIHISIEEDLYGPLLLLFTKRD